MVVCKCHKATQLYCFVHKVPVCGDCVCLPEHSKCVVKTYTEWVADCSDEFSAKCSLCLEILKNTDDPVIRLSCLHVLHTSCLLLRLQKSPSAKGYTCPSCASEIWPPKQHLVKFDSALCKRIGEFLFKGSISMFNRTSEALLPCASEPLPNLSGSLIASGQGIVGPVFSPHIAVSSTVTPLAARYVDRAIPKMQGKNLSHNECCFSAENGKNNSIPYAMIDIESAKFSAKAVGSPKLTKVLSRKSSSRGDRRTNDCPVEEDAVKGSNTPKGLQVELFESLLPCSSSVKPILPVTLPTQNHASESHSLQDSTDGRWRRYRRTTMDPRKILFIFATLSSVGTIILIYFTLTINKIGQDFVQAEVQ